ncbi:Ribosome-binding protein 1 [Bienertia sinuspersici]
MALTFRSPFLLSHPSSSRFLSSPYNSHNHHHHKNMFLLLLHNNLEPSFCSLSCWNSSSIDVSVQASTSSTQNDVANGDEKDEFLLDDELISRASSLNDASEVLQLIVETNNGRNGGVVSCFDCCKIISTALFCNNSDLALSIFAAMRSSAIDQAARTHRFATETPDVPAQVGERVTIALAAPSSVFREVGPVRFSAKPPKHYPSQPLCLTNHQDSRESLLLRAPSKDNKPSLLNPSVLLPLLVLLASGDAASGLINPSLPQLLPAAAAASLAMGVALNTMVLPQLVQLPERTVDAIAIKQQLLAQYDLLQSRIKDLKDAAENEVWMLARICQLENKINAVGEPSYRARRTRIKRVRESLEISLRGRMELIDSYARISSMIEIEVEMDIDVLAAEASSNKENIAKQIEQIIELENLEERWRQQAEANDEVEKLLSSEPLSSQQV